MEETVKCNLEKLGKSIFMGEGKAWLGRRGGRDREKRGRWRRGGKEGRDKLEMVFCAGCGKWIF